MVSTYLVLKSLHIIGIISWMAGILYFYRLFIYHFDYAQTNHSNHVLLSLMEKRLFKYITVPAMIISAITGLAMAYFNSALLSERWFQIKFIGAVSMMGVTLYGLVLL